MGVGSCTKEDLMKTLFSEKPEASWCRTCLKREKCKIKEEVAFEKNMIDFAQKSHLRVKVECKEYINDAKAKDIKNDLIRKLAQNSYR